MAKKIVKKTPAKAPAKKPAPDKKAKKHSGRVFYLIFGLLVVVVSACVLVSLFSYLFTGNADQLIPGDGKYTNLMGKGGAVVSRAIMSRMGIASFFFFTLTGLTGLYMIAGRRITGLIRPALRMTFIAIWLMLVIGYFPDTIVSGRWGNELNRIAEGWIGWGLAVLLAVIPVIYLIVRLEITPEKIRAWNQKRQVKKLAEEHLENPDTGEKVPWDESDGLTRTEPAFGVVDAYGKPEEGTANEEDEPVSEEEDENDHFGQTDEPIVLRSGDSGEEVLEESREGGIEVEVKVHRTELSDERDLAQTLVEKYGQYDPTLELANFQPPSLDLLRSFDNEEINVAGDEVAANRQRIVDTLKNYGIEIAKISSTVGPTITLYEIIPAPGIKISKIKNLEDDIALSLSALGIRIIAPMPGRGTIGIEVPNKEPSIVSMRSVIASKKFQTSQMELPVAMGKTISGEPLIFDLTKMPHLLMAGATGQGKSVGLNAVIASLLYKKHPSQVKFVLIDPKRVELTLYNKIERHYLAKIPNSEDAIITDTSKVINTLNSLCIEMSDRLELFKDAMVRNIKEYNTKFVARRLNPEKGHRYMPYIVLVIDEFADLIMTAGKEIETPIARLAQLARAVGIHLIIATQRPSVNVITGLIKANFPARIAFRVMSKIDSRTILDAQGADQLIGKGDMLFTTANELIRAQCAFIDTPEVEEICEFIGSQRGYPEALQLPEYEGGEEGEGGGNVSMDELDPLFADAARWVVASKQGSASVIQRKFSIGYNRAGRIVDQLEACGIVGPFNGSKAREVLVGDEETLARILNK